MRKSLESDPRLRVEKKSIYEDLNFSPYVEDEQDKLGNLRPDESSIKKSEAAESSTKRSESEAGKKSTDPKDEIIQLEFKWDKKSTGSTDSLLESDAEVIWFRNFLNF